MNITNEYFIKEIEEVNNIRLEGIKNRKVFNFEFVGIYAPFTVLSLNTKIFKDLQDDEYIIMYDGKHDIYSLMKVYHFELTLTGSLLIPFKIINNQVIFWELDTDEEITLIDKIKEIEDESFAKILDIITSLTSLENHKYISLWYFANFFVKKNEILEFFELDIANIKENIINSINKNFKKIEESSASLKSEKAIQKFFASSQDQLTIIYNKINSNTLIPEETRSYLLNELSRLKFQNPSSPEYGHTLNYLTFATEVPFGQYSSNTIKPSTLLDKLNNNHFGLKIAKEKIIEHIAVQEWTGSSFGEVICLVGPPGVGKSSIANVLAKELNRKFIKMAVGGLSDEAELRGHKRSYHGAESGRLVKELIKIGTLDPVIIIDEIDKLGTYKGSPGDALLEILDPEQNDHFVDRYLGFPIDISKALFICTANYIEGISAPLLNRMSIINIEGYTQEEQFTILKDFIVPKYKKMFKLQELTISEDILSLLTVKEKSGARDAERYIKDIMKKSCYYMLNQSLSSLEITPDNIKDINFTLPKKESKNSIGFK